MRVVRRASLILSVVLIVAIAVGYFVRTAEQARVRDLQLLADAQVGAAELASLIDEAEIAARAGVDPAAVASAIANAAPGHGVCVVGAEATVCDGDEPRPPSEMIDLHTQSRREGEPISPGVTVTSYEERVTIVAVGPTVSVLVDVSVRPGDMVFPTTYLPGEAAGTSFFGDDRVRQTAVAVPSDATGLYIVAAADADVSLPSDEIRFYFVVFSLAVVLLALAGITLVVEHRSLVERASFDPLTKLPNRSEFERRVDDVLMSSDDVSACLLLFDLDGFKAINDTYGHHAGDDMLQLIGERLRGAVRSGDVVARWGGDEFVVLLVGVDNAEMGSRRARALVDQIGGRTRLEGVAEPLRVKASVGVALWGEHGNRLADLVEAADSAMYEAKRSGIVSCVASPSDESTMSGV